MAEVLAGTGAGIKHDAGKLRFDLIPADALFEVVAAITWGSIEYGDENWRELDRPRTRFFAAAMRHGWKWFRGEERDDKTGLHHLAHFVVNGLFLLDLDLLKKL